jgi:pyruvate ferredoxin oxidoreductase gamma subunit
VDATGIATETLGRPIVNTAMLGAFVRVTGIVHLTSLIKTVEEYFKGKGAVGNVNAVKLAHDGVKTR